MPMTPAEFGKLIADETEKWGKVGQGGERLSGARAHVPSQAIGRGECSPRPILARQANVPRVPGSCCAHHGSSG